MLNDKFELNLKYSILNARKTAESQIIVYISSQIKRPFCESGWTSELENIIILIKVEMTKSQIVV